MSKRIKLWACALLVLTTLGCESSSDMGGGTTMKMSQLTDKIEGKTPPPPAAAAPENGNAAAPAAAAPAGREGAPPAAASPAGEREAPPADATKASDMGALKSNPNTYFGAIAGANRSIRERVADFSWQKSVQLYEASNGHKPKTTKEFVDHMLGEGTPLPPLDPGYEYLYVPEEGQFGELYKVKSEAPAADAEQRPPAR